MTIREPIDMLPTLKISPQEDDENAVKFEKDMQVTIMSIADVKTAFKDKMVLVVQDIKAKKDELRYSVFLNARSNNALIKAFGKNDENWVGKICNLKLELSPKPFTNKMIVFHPVK